MLGVEGRGARKSGPTIPPRGTDSNWTKSPGEEETELINWQIVARYSKRPCPIDFLAGTPWQLSFSAGRLLMLPRARFPRDLIETRHPTTLDAVRRAVFQWSGHTTPLAIWIDRGRAIIGFPRIESSRRSCRTRKLAEGLGRGSHEKLPKVHFIRWLSFRFCWVLIIEQLLPSFWRLLRSPQVFG